MTAGLCGHSNSMIRDVILSTTFTRGVSLGATTDLETQFAEKIRDRFPSMELLRFCNSGTEANLYALSIARRATGLSKVIVFTGGYHGGVLSFVHGVAENNVNQDDWVIGTYNDVEGVKKLISDNKGIAAAVLVEGMQGAGGCIPGAASFLHAIQAATKENGMVFILDEVMTSRLAPGGLQSTTLNPLNNTTLTPDITTLGKWIAGGITIGVFGGRRELLSLYDPRATPSPSNPEQGTRMSHSGTFNNNTLAMNVGLITLSAIYTAPACTELNSLGDWFRKCLLDICQGTRMTVTGVGSICNIHFVSRNIETDILRVEDLEAAQTKFDVLLGSLLWYYVLSKGFWIARRGMLALTLGTTKVDLQGFLDVLAEFVQEFSEFIT